MSAEYPHVEEAVKIGTRILSSGMKMNPEALRRFSEDVALKARGHRLDGEPEELPTIIDGELDAIQKALVRALGIIIEESGAC